jgi:hypothetical protein
MSVVVLAVSRSVVAVGADQLHLNFSMMPPEPHFDYRKVFRGDHVVGAMTGVADTPAGSLLDELVGAMRALTLVDAVKTFRSRTQPWLTSAYRHWRSYYGADAAPEELFAAVVIGGITKGGPGAVELYPPFAVPKWYGPNLSPSGLKNRRPTSAHTALWTPNCDATSPLTLGCNRAGSSKARVLDRARRLTLITTSCSPTSTN